VVASRVCCCF